MEIENRIDVRCRCCGVPVRGERQRFRVCCLCDQCDEKHGDALQAHVCALVARGFPMWQAIARMAIDNAQLCGAVVLVGDPNAAELRIPEQPRPWQVVAARSLAKREPFVIGDIVAACLAPFIPGPKTNERMQALADELTSALHFVDPNVVAVNIQCDVDSMDPEHLIIQVQMQAATDATTVIDDVKIPADIMRRKRAEA